MKVLHWKKTWESNENKSTVSTPLRCLIQFSINSVLGQEKQFDIHARKYIAEARVFSFHQFNKGANVLKSAETK